MSTLIGFLFDIYLASIGVSTGVQLYKNCIADIKIKKEGYEIINNNTILENICDFILKYNYIFIPVINLRAAYELIMTSNKKYKKYRFNRLEKENKIKKSNKKEQTDKEEKTKEPIISQIKNQIKEKVKQIPVKQEVKKQVPVKQTEKPKQEIKKQVPVKQTEKPKQEIKKQTPVKQPEVIHIKDNKYDVTVPFKEEIQNSTDIYFLEALKKEYRKKSDELRQQYQVLLNKHNNTTDKNTKKQLVKELNSIVSKVQIYDEIFVCARDRISELKNKQTKHR